MNCVIGLILGHGVFTSIDICNKAVMLQYRSEMISCSNLRELECSYPPHIGSFIFYYKSTWYVIQRHMTKIWIFN